MITDEQITKKAKELNMEVIRRFNKNNQDFLELKCNTHTNKPSRIVSTYNFVNKNKTCGCRLKFYTEEDFKQDIINLPIKLIGKYKNDSEKTTFQCEKGHKWEASPNKIKQGRGCPICKGDVLRKAFIKSQEQFINELNDVNPTLELVSQYNGMTKKITYRCKICGNLSTAIADKVIRMESSCHFCKSSLGERIIMNYLRSNNIDYIPQKTFEGCKNINLLHFDFYLPKYNLCIEYQGEQHYRPVDFSYTPTQESKEKAQKKFIENQKRDEIKRFFCKSNGINLLEISYKEIKQISKILEKELL